MHLLIFKEINVCIDADKLSVTIKLFDRLISVMTHALLKSSRRRVSVSLRGGEWKRRRVDRGEQKGGSSRGRESKRDQRKDGRERERERKQKGSRRDGNRGSKRGMRGGEEKVKERVSERGKRRERLF